MGQSRNNSGEFLSIYNELDEYMRRTLSADDSIPHRTLIERISKKNNIFGRYRGELIDFAKLRNAIVHNPYKNVAEPIAEPHDSILDMYRGIRNRIINPSLAMDIAVKAKDIFCASIEDNALEVMRMMNENSYSHVPIVEKHRVSGVFSQYSIFSYLLKNQSVCLDCEMKIQTFKEFLGFEAHRGEYFEFISRLTLASEVERMFQRRMEDHRRLGVIFVTENGESHERLLGIITGWDIARYSG